jgi:hypothetical protein
VRRELERIEIPGEHEARGHTWTVVAAAFTERAPAPPARRVLRPALAFAAVLALAAGALSPPGRALIGEVREAVGVERAAPALFSLPAEGRLLVTADGGTWVARDDGSKRLLGPWTDAAWSPHGRFVALAGGDELVAAEPGGDVRWTLARRGAALPAWGGTATDTRIAYLSRNQLRVVAGDGTGDRALASAAARARPAWRPRSPHVLTYGGRHGRVVAVEADSGRVLWRTPPGPTVAALEWSGDGRRLLVRRGGRVDVHARDGTLVTGFRHQAGAVVAAAVRPGSHAHAYAVTRGGQTRVALVGEPSRVLFTGPGRIDQLAWSPDGRWLLLAWRDARQWVFVPVAGGRVRVTASIPAQFRSTTFPTIHGWCCASSSS